MSLDLEPARPAAMPVASNADAPERGAAALRGTRLGAGLKLLYGGGGALEGVTNAALTYFLLFYLTAVCGLSGTLAGASSMIALTIDAVADPAIGLISDNTRSRLGRRAPYLILSTLPIALTFVLLFSIPRSLAGVALFAYATACSIALRVGLSFFLLPYAAVGAEMSDDYRERSSIIAYRLPFVMVGSLCAVILGLGVFMAGPAGTLNRAAYIPFAWSCSGIVVLAGIAGSLGTLKVLPRLHGASPLGGPILRELRQVFDNRSFRQLFATIVVFMLAQGAAGALTLHATRYFWRIPSSGAQIVVLGLTLGPLFGIPLSLYLARFLEKRSLTILSAMAFAVLQIAPSLLRILGLMPAEGSVLVGILFVVAIISGAMAIVTAIGSQSMMADVADEHQHLFGVRREGLFFSGLTFAVKAALGLGSFVGGVALDVIHFPTQLAASGQSLQLSAVVARNLGLASTTLPGVISLIAPLFLIPYSLTRAKHAAILSQLERRASGSDDPIAAHDAPQISLDRSSHNA